MNKSVVYAQTFGKIYKLLDIIIRNDESIYVCFPRKKGYLIKNKQDVDLDGQSIKTLSFEKNISKNIFNPYISFHPGKGVIHINAQNGHKKFVSLLTDRQGFKLDELVGSNEFVPFVTIVIPPDLFIFDSVDIPNKNNLIINAPTTKPLSLSVDILIHEKGGYVDKNELPLSRLRNLAFLARLNENLSKILTYSLAFNNVPVTGNELSTEVIAFVWNKSTPFSFCLSPIRS